MTGNALFHHSDAAVLTVTAVDAPVVVTSTSFDERLAPTYARTGVPPGLLQRLAGIHERRVWPEGVSFVDGAIEAGAKAIAESGIDPAAIGLMINTSVSRDHLEPSVAVRIHHELGMPSSCLNFDLANACLGFVNGMQLAATMIDAGQIEYALIVDGEGTNETHENTLRRLEQETTSATDFQQEFATLTLGSGAAAMVLGRHSTNPGGHRLVGGVSRAATQHHDLCVGSYEQMRTDTKRLLRGGIALAKDLWADAAEHFDWNDMTAYIGHQVSRVHTESFAQTLGLDPDRIPRSYPTRGNTGPAAVPMTLAASADSLESGDRVLLLGIGSGLNMTCLEVQW